MVVSTIESLKYSAVPPRAVAVAAARAAVVLWAAASLATAVGELAVEDAADDVDVDALPETEEPAESAHCCCFSCSITLMYHGQLSPNDFHVDRFSMLSKITPITLAFTYSCWITVPESQFPVTVTIRHSDSLSPATFSFFFIFLLLFYTFLSCCFCFCCC